MPDPAERRDRAQASDRHRAAARSLFAHLIARIWRRLSASEEPLTPTDRSSEFADVLPSRFRRRLGRMRLDRAHRRSTAARPRSTKRWLLRRSYVADRSLATVLFLSPQARPAAVSRRRGRRRQDRDRQGPGLFARPQADPPAMLRRPRRRHRRLRVELPRADDGDPPLGGGGRARQGPHRARRVLRALPHQAAAPAGDGAERQRRAGAADRRDRPGRRGVRGLSPRRSCPISR